VPYNHIRPTAARPAPGWLGLDRHSGLPNSGKNLPPRSGPQSSPLPCDLLLKTDFINIKKGGMTADIVDQLPAEIAPVNRLLTAAEFHRLTDVPPEVEWFANLSNPSTRRAYGNAIRDFMRFTGIARPEEFRTVTRVHILAWRDQLTRRGLGGSTNRHRLASLASFFEYLCEKNAVTHNPVKGVERPRTESGEGKTPAIGDHQARELLAAPQRSASQP
jgi:hypothetical protein